jgi:hypothetical protein
MGAPTKQEASPKGAERVPLATATVARGRTVVDLEGKRHAAGEEVELPSADVVRLRARGFLVDPKKPAIPLADGPTFGSMGGPRVKRG